MYTITSEINRLQFWGGLGVVIAFFILQDSNIPRNRTTDLMPLLFTLISVQYPISNTHYIQYLHAKLVQFTNIVSVHYTDSCLPHLVGRKLSCTPCTSCHQCRSRSRLERLKVKRKNRKRGYFYSCTTASICCVEDVKTRTAFLARWEIPTDFGHLATHRLPTKKCADVNEKALQEGWHGSRPFMSTVATIGDSVVTAYGP